MNKNKGFTLIELLVVIAIIGILASIVLAALGTARDKARAAAVGSALSSMRAQAELFYSSNNNYGTSYSAGVIASGGASILPPTCSTDIATNSVAGNIWYSTSTNGLFNLLKGACSAGATAITGSVDANPATKWAILAAAPASTWYCVDSSGTSKSYSTGQTIAGTNTCP